MTLKKKTKFKKIFIPITVFSLAFSSCVTLVSCSSNNSSFHPKPSPHGPDDENGKQRLALDKTKVSDIEKKFNTISTLPKQESKDDLSKLIANYNNAKSTFSAEDNVIKSIFAKGDNYILNNNLLDTLDKDYSLLNNDYSNVYSLYKEYMNKAFTFPGKNVTILLDQYNTVNEIINTLNQNLKLSFSKSVGQMTPLDLYHELIKLRTSTDDGIISFIVSYKGETELSSANVQNKLNQVINAFGDPSKISNKRSLFPHGGIPPGIIQLFQEYARDISIAGISYLDLAGLIGNLPSAVVKLFPDLLSMFTGICKNIEKNSTVINWANLHPDQKNNVLSDKDGLDHQLVRFVLSSPHN